MRSHSLPPLTLGLDVVTPEGSLPRGAARRVTNVVLANDGAFSMRPGFDPLFIDLPRAHSFWISPAQTRVFAAADTTLYEIDLDAGTATALFTALPFDQPVEYDDVGPDVYFTCAGVLRKVAPDGTVRRPGVASLVGVRPTLAATTGGLPPGRYGVAYGLVNDLGEESGTSNIAWITLATGGGIALSGIQTAANVEYAQLYITAPNGPVLRRQQKVAIAATASIVDDARGDACTRLNLQPMPGGSIVRYHKGRVYVVDGNWVWISDPLDYGVSNVESGWLTVRRTITSFQPVAGGIFMGLRERTVFLAGDGPEDFRHVNASAHGALPQSGTVVPPDFFSSGISKSQDQPVAAWLSEIGLAIGRVDGSIAYPQENRIALTGGASRPLFAQYHGIKQGIFCVESLETGTGGAVDSTI